MRCARVAVFVFVCVAQILGVPLGTSKADCKKAYFKLAKIWHPDKHQQVLSLPTLVGPFCAEPAWLLDNSTPSFPMSRGWRCLPRWSSIHRW